MENVIEFFEGGKKVKKNENILIYFSIYVSLVFICQNIFKFSIFVSICHYFSLLCQIYPNYQTDFKIKNGLNV
jgi:hypothetical protein